MASPFDWLLPGLPNPLFIRQWVCSNYYDDLCSITHDTQIFTLKHLESLIILTCFSSWTLIHANGRSSVNHLFHGIEIE